MATNSGLSAAQNAYYEALMGAQAHGDPNALMDYVKGLNDYQSLASLANTQGKFAPINVTSPFDDGSKTIAALEQMYQTPIVTIGTNGETRQSALSNAPTQTTQPASTGGSGVNTQPPVGTGGNQGSGASPVNQFESSTLGLQFPNDLPVSNGGREWGTPETVGASSGQLMGAGNANYNSALIKSLRQSSMNPFSTNPGVQMTPNSGQTTVNWTPPSGQGSAFNPQVFNPRAASPQEVTDWNAYNAYRSSSVSASNPYLSLTDWIAQGRPTGVNNTNSNSGNQSYDGGIG